MTTTPTARQAVWGHPDALAMCDGWAPGDELDELPVGWPTAAGLAYLAGWDARDAETLTTPVPAVIR